MTCYDIGIISKNLVGRFTGGQAMRPVWEEVESGMNRAPVPGGWIVQQYDQRYNERMERWEWIMVGAFFIIDEAHAWDIT